MDCGPTCLRMVAKYYGRSFSLQRLRTISGIGREGVSLLGICQAAEKIGFHARGVRIDFEGLEKKVTLPCIIHWKQNHFIIVYRVKKKKVYIADPAKGLLVLGINDFLEGWVGGPYKEAKGVALLLEPSQEAEGIGGDEEQNRGFGKLFDYLFAYKKLLVQLMLGLLIGSVLQLIFPFLTQSIVDIGVNNQNLNFIYLVLIAQSMLFIGRASVEFIRSWILLHISTRINISLLSDFFIKLMRLPLSFFDVKMTGDIIQRISDHQRIESFLTGTSLNVLFSLFNLIVFGAVLAIYDVVIFLTFLTGSILYALWIFAFLRRRRGLDYSIFEVKAKEQSSIIELITGMQEIKLANAEVQKRWKWEDLQAKSFKLSMKALSLNQNQQAGALLLNEGKNILITFLAAKSVITGDITLGAMLAIQYMIGQLNGPIEQLIGFMHSIQDAKISFERLNEIHDVEEEEPIGKPVITELPQDRSLTTKGLAFSYPGAGNIPVFEGLNIQVPHGKVTAIVGMSGSGKTTLLKLLLKFYDPSVGEVKVGDTNLKNVSQQLWRSKCGVVMQEGFIFSDTIANNIAVGEERIDTHRLLHAVKVANIHDFIDSLPLSFNTKIGQEGNGISQGQKQRILIARAVYKNPEYLFFDEATNALDANNESIIMQNLETFFQGRTVVVVAHRLSTVRNADQIIVLEKGKVVEQGNHFELVYREGKYYELVKNQLELGE